LRINLGLTFSGLTEVLLIHQRSEMSQQGEYGSFGGKS